MLLDVVDKIVIYRFAAILLGHGRRKLMQALHLQSDVRSSLAPSVFEYHMGRTLNVSVSIAWWPNLGLDKQAILIILNSNNRLRRYQCREIKVQLIKGHSNLAWVRARQKAQG